MATKRVQKEPPKTVTCQHCRYERPADDERCHICGYPWPFAEKARKPAAKSSRK